MCGRFALGSDRNRLADHYGLTNVPVFTGGYNIAPSAQVPVVRHHPGREAAICHWGFIPHWVKDPRTETHQCPRGDPRRKAVLPGCVQTAALPDTGQRLLRMAGGGRQEAALFHTNEGVGSVFLCRTLVVMAGAGTASWRAAPLSRRRQRRSWSKSTTGCRQSSNRTTMTPG